MKNIGSGIVWKYPQVAIPPHPPLHYERSSWVIVNEADSWGWGRRGKLQASWVMMGMEEDHRTGREVWWGTESRTVFYCQELKWKAGGQPSLHPAPLHAAVTLGQSKGQKQLLDLLLLRMTAIWETLISPQGTHHHTSGTLGWCKGFFWVWFGLILSKLVILSSFMSMLPLKSLPCPGSSEQGAHQSSMTWSSPPWVVPSEVPNAKGKHEDEHRCSLLLSLGPWG